MREYSARVDVYRNGAKLTELRAPADGPPEITAEEGGEIPTGLRGRFMDNEAVNWLTDELRPVQLIDGVEYPAGVFLPARVTISTYPIRMAEVEAYDRAYRLKTTISEDVIKFDAGIRYSAAVGSLLTDAGIELWQMDDTDATLQTTRADWPLGTEFITIINELLAEVNFDPIWFDQSGVGQLRRHREPDGDNVVRVYDSSAEVLLQEDAGIDMDLWEKPNVFIAVCQNPELSAPLVRTVVNDSPASALSTVRRGRRIARVYKVDNIASSTELQRYAERVRLESMMTAETLTLQTANLPGLGLGEAVGITHPEANGIYREIGWSLVLAPGQMMTHILQKKVII